MKKHFIIIAMTGILASMTGCGSIETGDAVSLKTTTPTTTASVTATVTSGTKTSTTTAKTIPAQDQTTASIITGANNEKNDSDYEIVNADIQNITGLWIEECEFNPRTLKINSDYSYELIYSSGGSQYGTVKIETAPAADGSPACWYNLYENDGTIFMSFPTNSDESPRYHLYSGHGRGCSFIRDMGNASGGISAFSITPDDFIGTWSVGRCYININSNGNGTYNVDVKWNSSAAEGSAWTYICTYDAENAALVCDGTGVNVDYVYTIDGQSSFTENYNDGSAIFTLNRNGCLMWHDYYANVADGDEFIRI
ncbi:MAG: hypothetical protein K6G33_10300 [Ruminococcus sp.]|uniref:hypothetical protein n=1 Tax=Ruminococcus sp. TaxID=41978 RepID=UPI0025F0C4AF|nr:hypothetical protein [Ruminococcus sp.]MCR5601115.1 hypothetical protein [Ruminococcus sp.]